MKNAQKIDLGLTGYDELFMNEAERKENKLPRIYDIPISEIDDFPDHPFKVKIDEDMDQLVQSIKERGIITPVTLRPKEDGRYEIVSGHRRKKACELAGFETVKAEVREMTRDEAIILMVESNLQRSTILPSEKAFSYKMRLEAMKRQQGERTDLTSVPVGQKLSSREILAENSPDMVNDKSTKNVWWKCHVCGYEWKQQIKTRVKGGECPSCSNRCAITGYNDLASTEPELMKEWDYSKNKIDPTKILRTAYNRAWWKCEFGHSWNAPICDRTLGDCSCKECESEFIASLPQLLTMYYARENNLNVVLRTTDAIGLPVDAYIPYFNLVVDGFEHSRKIKAVKKSLCNQNGITYCEINSKDPFAMATQIKALFRKNHVYITSENENDIRFCRNLFFSVKRKNARTS